MSESLEARIIQLAKQRDSKTGKWVFGRKGILKHVPQASEWQVRKIIQEVRGESIPGKQAPTPEERKRMVKESEQVKLPTIVVTLPQRKVPVKPKAGNETWILAGDFHVPYQHEPSVNILYQITEALNPSKFVVLGDLLNLDPFSKYPGQGKYPEAPTWVDEISAAGPVLGNIRLAAPNADLEWFQGNHELRLKKHLMREDPILFAHMNIPKLFVLSDNDTATTELKQWKYVEDAETYYSDLKLIVKHGTRVRKKAGASAMAEVDSLLLSVVMGHCHRLGVDRKSSGRSRYGDEQPLFGMETGCMCHYDLEYMEGQTADWQHGFGILTIDRSGDRPIVHPEVVEISNDRAIFRGQTYKG